MLLQEKENEITTKTRVCRCIYCGNELFEIEDDALDLKEHRSIFSPEHVINVRGVEDKRFPSDRVELFCCRCGVSLGYMLVDRSGLMGDRTYIRANMLEVSSDIEDVA